MSKGYSRLLTAIGVILVALPCVLVNVMDLDFTCRTRVLYGYIFGSPIAIIVLAGGLLPAKISLNRDKKIFRFSLLSFLLWCYFLLIAYTNPSEGLGMLLAVIFMLSTPLVLIFLVVGLFYNLRE